MQYWHLITTTTQNIVFHILTVGYFGIFSLPVRKITTLYASLFKNAATTTHKKTCGCRTNRKCRNILKHCGLPPVSLSTLIFSCFSGHDEKYWQDAVLGWSPFQPSRISCWNQKWGARCTITRNRAAKAAGDGACVDVRCLCVYVRLRSDGEESRERVISVGINM